MLDRVHWVVDPLVNGSFIDGALWAFSGIFDQLFGPILGPELLQQATQVEEYRAGGWVPVTV